MNETYNQLTLFARSANRLKTSERESVIAGDVTKDSDLDKAIAGQDVVFVALSGSLGRFAQKIVAAMDRNKVSRLRFHDCCLLLQWVFMMKFPLRLVLVEI
ncbi:putative oxidoreductase (putative) [Lactiplantibacillus plantarum]|nr:putative oxidoreductase (putative) [Lactiplantibacillus plantarum]